MHNGLWIYDMYNFKCRGVSAPKCDNHTIGKLPIHIPHCSGHSLYTRGWEQQLLSAKILHNLGTSCTVQKGREFAAGLLIQ